MHWRRFSCRVATALAICTAVATPGSASELLATSGAPGHLRVAVDGANLTVSGAETSEHLRLPLGTRLTRAAQLEDGWIVAGTTTSPTGSRLYLVISKAGRVERLPQPARSGGRLVVSPVLLLADQALEGIAWLEGTGPRSLTVRAASWTGTGWGSTHLVSPRGPGSQLALSATVLADGSKLLVWSRFDGKFDQIAWSLKRGDSWSTPRNLTTDSVPDITPGITAVGTGALAAWSHFDGHDYRIALARFDGTRWQRLGTLPEKGAVSPTFTPGSAHRDVALLFPSVIPRVWSVQVLNSQGELVRRGSVPLRSYSRPILVEGSGEWKLLWSDRSIGVALKPLFATTPLQPE